MSLKVSIEKNGLENIKLQINYVDKLLKMKTDKNYQKFIQEKCLETVKGYARERLYGSGTTNEDLYEEYINNIHLRDTKKGFDIVSDLTIYKPPSKHSDGYNFSISMAFEYGVGIVGQGSADAPSGYLYNVNDNYVKINGESVQGWWIPADKVGNSVTFGTSNNGTAVITQGYEGLEIFRFSRVKIMENLKSWVHEYFLKLETGEKQ